MDEIEYADCDWCGNEFDSDDLSITLDGGLVCEDCYEQAQAELNGE